MISRTVEQLADDIAFVPEAWAIAVSEPDRLRAHVVQLRERLSVSLTDTGGSVAVLEAGAGVAALVQQLRRGTPDDVKLVTDTHTLSAADRRHLDGIRTALSGGPGVVIATTAQSLAGLQLDMPHLWSWIGGRIFAISAPDTTSGALEQHFDIADSEEVHQFIARRPGLESLLLEATRQIATRFGETRSRLGIHRNPEWLESIDLVLLIPWRGTAEDVIPRTDALEEWWLDQNPELTHRVIVDVQFVRP